MRLGYACINMTLKPQVNNRTLKAQTLRSKGYEYLCDLIIENLENHLQIIQWNHDNDIHVFRLTSELFPFMSHPELGYEVQDLPKATEILNLLQQVGQLATDLNQRLTFHPGPFNVLGSTTPKVVESTITELNSHSRIFDLMGFEPSPYNKINIHIGATYGFKEDTMNRWIQNFHRLDENTQKRLTIENDDKATMYSTQDLYDVIYKAVGIPIVFDIHHHICYGALQPAEEALDLAISTWPADIRPVCHYSESKSAEKPRAHSEYVTGPIDFFGREVDVIIESKGKDLALLQYRDGVKTLVSQ